MATANSSPTDSPTTDEAAVKAVNKRYEGLITVRSKAVKGKGAWYWAHLEPILVRHNTNGLPKAVKLKCVFCNNMFSASNPSRTATEHLKRGTCPNFTSVLNNNNNNNNNPIYSSSPSASPTPLSAMLPLPPPPLPPPQGAMVSPQNHRKRGCEGALGQCSSSGGLHAVDNSLAMVESTRFCGEFGYNVGQNQVVSVSNSTTQQLVLSGGKEDLGALAMLEDSIKKLKSPKSSPGPTLSKDQIESAFDFLADWFYESCGSVSISSLEHPKFKTFLNHVGLPVLSCREIFGSRLDSKFDEVRIEAEARIRDVMFFQIACDGWRKKNYDSSCEEDTVVNFSVNLPNGTSVFKKAIFMKGGGSVPSKYAEEIMWEAITSTCGGIIQRCVGIVSDKYKATAMKSLEIQNHWMVNVPCLLQGFLALLKDFSKELSLFRKVIDNCTKLANFVNSKSQVRNIFLKLQLQELDHAGLLRVPMSKCDYWTDFTNVCAMFEDILGSSQVLQLVVMNNSYEVVCADDPIAREVADMIQGVGFWNQLDAIHSLVNLIREMAQEIEIERPFIAQCLQLWEELRAKVKDWCVKYNIAREPVEIIVERRFTKNYHPAWSAAFMLDPLYLIRDTNGKYVPPFKCLTHEQEKDVDKLITRLVSEDEAPFVLMELMKWRSEGLDPLYAQAVQLKQHDPTTGKTKIANPQSSRLVWETCLCSYKSLGKVAVRLIFLHATSCGFKCNSSFKRWFCVKGNSRSGLERAQKMIYIAAHAKLERRVFSSEEEKDAELLSMTSSDDDMLNGVFGNAPSVGERVIEINHHLIIWVLYEQLLWMPISFKFQLFMQYVCIQLSDNDIGHWFCFSSREGKLYVEPPYQEDYCHMKLNIGKGPYTQTGKTTTLEGGIRRVTPPCPVLSKEEARKTVSTKKHVNWRKRIAQQLRTVLTCSTFSQIIVEYDSAASCRSLRFVQGIQMV